MKNKISVWIGCCLAAWACHTEPPPITVGIIADCQYCACDYSPQWNNDYKQAIPRLKQAVAAFNSESVDLVFHLGDFIDRDFASYTPVCAIMNEVTMPYYYVLGNHEFSVADSLKSKVYTTLNLHKPYYTVKKRNWLFVVLDGTDISPYHSNDSMQVLTATQAMDFYARKGRPQAKPWNGALGSTQMQWLEATLTHADSMGLQTLVLAHFPVFPAGDLTLWNDKEVRALLEQHPSVKAYFNGHDHPGNYAQHKGIHYLTFQAMVLGKKSNAFSVVQLYNNKIKINGFGREPNRLLDVKR